jgi:hypothetical protein
MANTYKNIVITPNTASSTGDPTIVFSGGNTTVNTDITLRVYPEANGTLSFEGAAGQLFSITNDLTGSIYSVNDVSGIPSIDVQANGMVSLAPYGGNVAIDGSLLFVDTVGNEVGIGTMAPLAKLEVVSSSQAATDRSTHFELSTGTGLLTDEKLVFGISDGSYSWIQAVKQATGYRNLSLNPSGGNVAIGRTTANYRLDVAGQVNASALFINGSNAINAGNNWANTIGTSSNNYAGVMANSGNSWTQTIVDANLVTARAHTNTSTTAANNYAGVMANSANAWANSKLSNTSGVSFAGNLYFPTGNVGIGTNSPEYKLDVLGKSRIGYTVAQGNPNSTDITTNAHTLLSGTGGNYLTIGQYGSDKSYAQWIQSSFTNPTTATYNLILQPLGGKIGIGNNSPAYTVDVVGDVNVTGAFRVNGTQLSTGTVDLTPANNWANTVGVYANNYAGAMSNSVNAYTSAIYSTLTQLGQNWAVTNAAFARGNTSAQLAFFRVAANGSNLDAASNADTLTIRSSNNIILIANSTNDSIQITQNPSGVTATTYGGSSNIPVIVVDAFGRITSASNTTVNGMNYAYANTIWGVANAGFTVANAAFAKANAAATAASPTFTGTVNQNANTAFQTLTDGATINWDVSLGQIATVTLGGNRTIAAPTNLKVGTYLLHVIQDATGSRTLTWNAVFKWPAAVAPTLTTTGSRRDIISFVCDGTNLYGSFLPDVR